ncbi:general secretion pathway protein J [Halopseudomonas litoralis]|uniref:Type II secretion system protein J n=1 Tax=Halopseudomonas litoralis TaxID=797277 RepID=A0A1H1MMF1_9GAMM|nr:type II secretion system minor pseudopilin GspJ [Halopseudomonas litoralis]SDR87780.1 general secretion pathway protein J [Halopseudomonas litoralis]
MRRSNKSRQLGFTLLEMLIAMAVFAVMSVVAYQGLRAVLNADFITREQGQQLADLQVTLSVLERDLAQVVDVTVRDEFGDPLPPLRLRPGAEEHLLELVRAGAGGDQRLRRSAWQITDRGLERRLWPGVDIVDAESMRVRSFAELADEHRLLGANSGFVFIVRTPSGLERVDAWPLADADPEAGGLPVAVEVVLDLPGLGEIRRMMAVGL